ncbi:MAG TPA: hypothetical protein DCG57_19370 [Candidatus Riflebacteria bacterium]|nr:hypothetical protein [Candidatus Riflebacteria bacterium]
MEFSFNLLQNSSKNKQMASSQFLALAQKHKQMAETWKIPVSKEFEALFKDAISEQLETRKGKIESDWKVSRTNGTRLTRTEYLNEVDSFSKDYPERAGEIASIAYEVRRIDGFFRNLQKEKDIITADRDVLKRIKQEFAFLLDQNELAKVEKTSAFYDRIDSTLKTQKQKPFPDRLKAYDQLVKDVKESDNQSYLSNLKQESDDIIAAFKADPAALATKGKWLENFESEHFSAVKNEINDLIIRFNKFKSELSKPESFGASNEEYEKLLSEIQKYSSSDADKLKASFGEAKKGAKAWIDNKIAEFEQIPDDKDLRSAFDKFRTVFKSIDSHPAGKDVDIQSAWMKASQKLFKRLSEDKVLDLERKQNLVGAEKPFEKAYREIEDAKVYIDESRVDKYKEDFRNALNSANELSWPPATIIPQEAIDNWAKEPLEKSKLEIQKYLANEIERDFKDTDTDRWKAWAKFLTANKKQSYLADFPLQGVLKYLTTDFESYYRSGDSSSYDLLSQKLIFAATEELYRDMILKIRLLKHPIEREPAIQKAITMFPLIAKEALLPGKPDIEKLSKNIIWKDILLLYQGKVSGTYVVEVTPSKSSKICPTGWIWDFKYNNFGIQFYSEKQLEIQTKNFKKSSDTYTYTGNFSQQINTDVGFKIRFAGRFFNDENDTTEWDIKELEVKESQDEDSTYIFGSDVRVKFNYKVIFD